MIMSGSWSENHLPWYNWSGGKGKDVGGGEWRKVEEENYDFNGICHLDYINI